LNKEKEHIRRGRALRKGCASRTGAPHILDLNSLYGIVNKQHSQQVFLFEKRRE